MTDVVDRLVRFAGKVCLSTDTEIEAASEIERLRAEVEKYKAIASKAIREQIDVRKDERERCAKIVEEHWHDWPLEETVAAIREPADD